MIFSTPATAHLPRSMPSHHRPSRWIIPLLTILALGTASSIAPAAGTDDAIGLQQTADATQRELEHIERARQANRQLLCRLQTGRDDPTQLVADATLLAAQPAVCQLQQAFSAATSNMARLLLTMRSSHPRVQACEIEQRELREQLNRELDAAIRSAQTDQSRLDAQAQSLFSQFTDMQQRLQQLAAAQAECNNQLSLVQPQTTEPEQPQQRPCEPQPEPTAQRDAAPPQAVGQPAAPAPSGGPGRTLFAAAALVGGLLVSFGLYTLRGSFLTAATPPAPVATTSSTPSSDLAPTVRTGMTLAEALRRCDGK
jgi:hypothetical protein